MESSCSRDDLCFRFEFQSQNGSNLRMGASVPEPTPSPSESENPDEISMTTTILSLYCAQLMCYALITHSVLSAALHVHTLITSPSAPSLLPGSSTPPQSEGKGKHRESTSPSAVPPKRSAQGEGREQEEEEEEGDIAGSTAKRRREGSHMTSHMTILAKDGVADPQGGKLH